MHLTQNGIHAYGINTVPRPCPPVPLLRHRLPCPHPSGKPRSASELTPATYQEKDGATRNKAQKQILLLPLVPTK